MKVVSAFVGMICRSIGFAIYFVAESVAEGLSDAEDWLEERRRKKSAGGQVE